MTLFMLAMLLPITIYARCFGLWYRKLEKKISDASAATSDVAQETFGNIRTVKAFATEDYQTYVHNIKL